MDIRRLGDTATAHGKGTYAHPKQDDRSGCGSRVWRILGRSLFDLDLMSMKKKVAKLKVVISYSHRDTDKLERLKTHSAMLVREGGVILWHDRDISAGASLDREIAAQLSSCELFLPLVSPDFLSSGYCYNREMRNAIARHRKGELCIVPIVLEPCDWKSSPLGRFKALPRDGRPISKWDNENEAWLEVVTELRKIIKARRVVMRRPPRVAVRVTRVRRGRKG